jgi:CheY-like chemotaxis protein
LNVAHFGREELRLFPRRDGVPFGDRVVVNEFGIRFSVQLRGLDIARREDGHRHRNRDALGVDESVRESLPDLLEEFGFDVQTFASAGEFLASEVLGQTQCLLLDIAMPGMTGPALRRTRRTSWPVLPVLAKLGIFRIIAIIVLSREAS